MLQTHLAAVLWCLSCLIGTIPYPHLSLVAAAAQVQQQLEEEKKRVATAQQSQAEAEEVSQLRRDLEVSCTIHCPAEWAAIHHAQGRCTLSRLMSTQPKL